MKEWIRVTRDARGRTTVTVTVQEENVTAKWSTVAFSKIKDGIIEGRQRTRALVDEVKAAIEEDS